MPRGPLNRGIVDDARKQRVVSGGRESRGGSNLRPAANSSNADISMHSAQLFPNEKH